MNDSRVKARAVLLRLRQGVKQAEKIKRQKGPRIAVRAISSNLFD